MDCINQLVDRETLDCRGAPATRITHECAVECDLDSCGPDCEGYVPDDRSKWDEVL